MDVEGDQAINGVHPKNSINDGEDYQFEGSSNVYKLSNRGGVCFINDSKLTERFILVNV
jgi:hypothetical protein